MEDVVDFVGKIDSIVNHPSDMDGKVSLVCDELWEALVSQLDAQMMELAEDIVFARIDWPKSVEFTCRMP